MDTCKFMVARVYQKPAPCAHEPALSAANQRLLPELSELQTRALQAEIEHSRQNPQPPPPAPVAGLPGKLRGFD